ncbi:MAG: YceI family protein [Verrucomicrobia bacterium]|nr:YceI family protein [Verrucomicrobiota bacterium]
MKLRRSLFFLTLTLAAASAFAQTAKYSAAPGSKLKMDGTSTVHDWTVESALIGGTLEWDAAFDAAPKPGKAAGAKVASVIPVRSLKSGKSSMDAVMQDAMGAEKNPKISYQLTELTLKEAPKAAGDAMQFESKGDITVAGVTKPLAMPVTITRDGDKLKIHGATTLKMTDHGITPPAPALGLGLIKTGDEVKITFDWVTKKADAK